MSKSTTRRVRYYAYARRGDGLAWLDKTDHTYLTRYPHQVAYHQLEAFTGTTQLMTKEEHRMEQRKGRELAAAHHAINHGWPGAMETIHLEDPATGIVDTKEGWLRALAGECEGVVAQRLAGLVEVVWVEEPEPVEN